MASQVSVSARRLSFSVHRRSPPLLVQCHRHGVSVGIRFHIEYLRDNRSL